MVGEDRTLVVGVLHFVPRVHVHAAHRVGDTEGPLK